MSAPGHIYLVGFMGSGKSTVGPLIAERLAIPFLDLDLLIAEQHGPIPWIFEHLGEGRFREIEQQTLNKASLGPASVMATGGGILETEENGILMGRAGRIVWLRVSLDQALSRCLGDAARPLALDRPTFENRFRERQPLYASAEVVIDVDGKTPDEICQECIEKLKE